MRRHFNHKLQILIRGLNPNRAGVPESASQQRAPVLCERIVKLLAKTKELTL